MELSIIIPAYNAEKNIGKTIESILNQTFTDFELIIINDGSTDRTESVIREFQKKDDRIRYYFIKNSGSAVARNIGLKYAMGNYIGFVDADDLIDKTMYEKLVTITYFHNVDIVGSSYERIEGVNHIPEKTYFPKGYYDKGKIIKEIYPVLIAPSNMLETFPKNIWSKIFHRDLIKKNEITFLSKLRTSEDVMFTIECMLFANSFYYLPDEKLYKYIYNKESITNTYMLDSWSMMKENFVESKRLVEKFPYDVLKDQLPYAIVRNAMGSLRNEGIKTKKVSRRRQLENIKLILNEKILCENIDLVNIKGFSNTRKMLYYFMKYKKSTLIYFFSRLYNSLYFKFK